MSYTSWHTYGYGVCLSRLECDSMERMEKLLELAPEYYKSVQNWLKEQHIAKQERFSGLYREPKKMEDISLDEVIMAPEMIEPLEPWTDRKKKNVWAVVIDWSCHGEHGHLEEICTDYLDAKRKLTEYLAEEFDNSTLLQWQSDDRYATVSEKDSYECYEKEDYQENHYHICLERKDLVMSPVFIREITEESGGAK